MMTCPPYCVVLADDHAHVRANLKRVISQLPDLKIVGEAADGLELLDLLDGLETAPNLLLLDISMPRLSGLAVAPRVKEAYPGVKILILTVHNDEEYLHQALRIGVQGYMLKEDAGSELSPAIKAIQNGEVYISPSMSSKTPSA
jgi:DNA-binding NarL/FixJ family response regulator